MRSALACAATAFFLLTGVAQSAVLRVPSDYATIQGAIAAATNGDTVLVAPGTYTENLDFLVKAISLVGEGGPDATVLTPATTVPTVRFHQPILARPELTGFTIAGGSAQQMVMIENGSRPWIHHNVFRDHYSVLHNATEIASFSSDPIIEFNLFIHNRSIGGVGVFTGNGQILNNTFDDNSRGFWSQGSAVAKNNIVTNSVQFGIGDYRFAESDFNCVYNNQPDYGAGAVAGPNDITADPLYCSRSTEDFHLDYTSPCFLSGQGGENRGAFNVGCGSSTTSPFAYGITVGHGSITHVVDDPPDIIWRYAAPSGQPQSQAEIEVGSDTDWTVAELWDPLPFAGPDTVVSYAGLPLADSTNYYLRIRVNDGTMWGDWYYRAFHTNGIPSAPAPDIPADSAVVTYSGAVLYSTWSTDPDNDPVSYQFEVYADEGLTDLVAASPPTSRSWAIVPPLTRENQPHWWRVRATDGYEPSAWSPSRVFYLDTLNSPPDPVTLIDPVEGEAIPDQAPSFDWSDGVDPDPFSSVLYNLVIATDSAFQFQTVAPSVANSEMRYGRLPVAQRYWWKVRARDQHGAMSESAVRRFFIPGPGDMDMNQTLNLIDVIMIIDVAFRGAPVPTAAYLADVNGDCTTDVLDAVGIINYAFRGGPLPLALCPSGPTIRVPHDYPTITEALIAANTGDSILVAPGEYSDNINFFGKTVHVVGEGGPGVTILTPQQPSTPTVTFATGEGAGAELTGFTIKGGALQQHQVQIGNNASPWIHHNIFRDHVTYEYNAAEIGVYGGSPTISYNLFIHNRSLGGVGVFSGTAQILNNTFDDNSRGFWSQGNATAQNNIVTHSTEFGIGGTKFALVDYNCVFGNNPDYDYGALPGAHDLAADPLYCDTASQSYSLHSNSPCLGSGSGGTDRGAFGAGCAPVAGGTIISVPRE
jgi:hypothetical protein